MIHEKIYKGRFKIPETEMWYTGTLTFNPENGAKLDRNIWNFQSLDNRS